MADVLMNYSSLETAANQVNKAKTDLEEVTQFLSNAVSALEGNYSGESYNAFVNAWNESKPTMQRLAEAVGHFAPALNDTVARQRETETVSTKKMSELAF